ncbi:MAG: hypothetical protein KDI79_31635, partial [Anaerolineae bacterium]|nr:hypothetical protein [Anaerolineae bacterium]
MTRHRFFPILVVVMGVALIGSVSRPIRLAAAGPVESGPVAATAIDLTVNAAANRQSISPYIYGLNYAKPAFAAEIDLPLRRWGG